jgi:hypothetical protein
MPTADAERLYVGMKGFEFPHPIFTLQLIPPSLQRSPWEPYLMALPFASH